MAWSDLFAAVAFLLIIEGLFPFVAPRALRRCVATLGQMSDTLLRLLGMVLTIAGLVLLFVVRG